MDERLEPKPKSNPATQADSVDADRRRALRAEVIGLIVIAVAILVYTILRYGTHINWSAR